jgi:hypothetical protein
MVKGELRWTELTESETEKARLENFVNINMIEDKLNTFE